MSANSPKEITIKIKKDEQRYSVRFLEYESLTLMHDDPKLKTYVDQAMSNFPGDIDEIQITIKMVW